MELPDLAKIRRFALTLAVVIIALVMAGVRLSTPLEIAPLGVPMTIERPDLLTAALAIAASYSILRYIYYGMLVHPSPMRARRQLMSRKQPTFIGGNEVMEAFRLRAQADVNRLFPHVGKADITFDIMQDASGTHVKNMKIPRSIRILCWIENVDFLLPILANIFAIALWYWKVVHAS